jgi:hypothetical protein
MFDANAHTKKLRELCKLEKHDLAQMVVGLTIALDICQRSQSADKEMGYALQNPMFFIRRCGMNQQDLRMVMLGQLQYLYTKTTNGMTIQQIVDLVKEQTGSVVALLYAIKVGSPRAWQHGVDKSVEFEKEEADWAMERAMKAKP